MNKTHLPLIVTLSLGCLFPIQYSYCAEASDVCSFDQMVAPICATLEAAPSDQPVKIGDAQFPSKKALEDQVADFENRKQAVAAGKSTSILNKTEKERFSRLLDRAKVAAVKAIIGPDRAESDLSEEESNMLGRIRGVELSDLKSADDARGCEMLGYWGLNYTSDKISLCPIMNGYSDRSLIQALGTALGHTISECATVLPHAPNAGLKYKPIKADKNPLDLKCDSTRCSSGVGLRGCLLRSAGINSKPGFSFDHPDAQTHLALALDHYRAGLRKQDPKISEADIETFARKDMERNAKNWPACFPAETQFQAASATGDWLSAQIVVEDAKLNPAPAEVPTLSNSAGYLVDDACRLRKIRPIDKLFGHPKHEVRFNDVMFRNASFRNLVGCKRNEGAEPDCAISHSKKTGSSRSSSAPAEVSN